MDKDFDNELKTAMSELRASLDSEGGCDSDQLPETTNVSNKDSTDPYQRRGADSMAKKEGPREEKKYSRDVLSDRDLERLTITLRSDAEDDRRLVAKATDEQRKRFKQYRHHSFKDRWEPLSSDAPLDDEWFVADPEVLPEDDPGYLCDMCRHLDFATLFSKRGIPGNNVPSMPTKINIRGLWRVMQEDGNSCAFCGLLRRRIVQGRSIPQVSDADTKNSHFYINVLDDGPEYALRLEIQLEVGSETVERFVVQRLEESPQQPLAGRFVQQDRADMDQLRKWLQICEGTHASSDESHKFGLASLRVIDTEELCVHEVESLSQYACLSYVWGKGSQTQYTTITRDSLEAPNGLQVVDLPQTIKDAIKVTREAGLRYLWVDALCILQDDPDDKAKIISKMGPIYGGATLTIIASSNKDPHEGLPGMGTAHRPVAQDIATVQGMKLAVGLHDPRQPIPDIDGSVWSSRAWTFQERALSARSVYFTGSQMIFKCVHGAVMMEEFVPVSDPAFRHSSIEDQDRMDMLYLLWTHPSLYRWPNKGLAGRDSDATTMWGKDFDIESYMKMSPKEQRQQAPVFDITVDAPLDFMSSLGDENKSTPWDLYRRAVEDYTKRKLTRESDAVDAFAGVEHIVRQGMNTKFWFGLPSFAFEQALLWNARESLERRTQSNKDFFPSWSWAGWRGQVSYRGRGWKNSVLWDFRPVIRWSVREERQQAIDAFTAGEEKTKEEIQAFMEAVSKATVFFRALNPYDLHHLNSMGKDGWTVKHDEEYNRHIYTHDAYPGVRFTYPVDLPGQVIEDRPDMYSKPNGVLFFKAHAVPIITCDMKETPFKKKIEDRFLQIGINDESCSANYRPPWQRIVYHQGYRAGFLTLNNEECLPDEGDGCEYHLAAISIGSHSQVPSPQSGWDQYWNMEPRKLQEMFEEQWRVGRPEVFQPNETVEPSTGCTNEDGDPYWDFDRFTAGGIAVLDIYEVLLLRTVNGLSRRVGAGRIGAFAFSAARPEKMFVMLA